MSVEPSFAARVRFLVDDGSYASLSTLAEDGAPFGSLVAYSADETGLPILFVSSLAEHTKNFLRDARASLLVTASGDAPLERPRATFVGTIVPVPSEERESLLARYLARHPSAARYSAFADFGLHRLVPTRIRYVEGFGVMGFVTGEQYLRG